MKKRNNKLLYFVTVCMVMIIAFFVNVATPKAIMHDFTNYYGVTITNEQYMRLLNLGFDYDQIYYMTEDIFNENKDLVGTLVSREQRYYKTVYPTYGNSYTVEVTADEYYNHENGDELLGSITTNYKTLISSISSVGSLYRFNSTLSWNNIPSVKSYDVQAIGFTGPVHIDSAFTFYYTYANSSGVSTTSYDYFTKQYFSTGGSTTFKLPSSFIGLTSTMYFNVAKDSGAGTITSLHMCADYAHATTTVTGNQAASHSVTVGGISFGSSVENKFDSMPCADSYLAVNW